MDADRPLKIIALTFETDVKLFLCSDKFAAARAADFSDTLDGVYFTPRHRPLEVEAPDPFARLAAGSSYRTQYAQDMEKLLDLVLLFFAPTREAGKHRWFWKMRSSESLPCQMVGFE